VPFGRRALTLALSATGFVLSLTRPAHAQTAQLAPIEIYGSEQAPPDPRAPRDPGLRVRGGIVYLSGGIASNFAYNGTGGGAGLGFHLGAQVNNLIGVYLSARFDSVLVLNYGEGDVIVDFSLRDRVQLGIGLGGFGVLNLFSGGGAGLVVPFHFAATPALWHLRDGSRTGFSIGVDLAPGIGFGNYYYSSTPVAFSANLSVGWEWY
jgi:hypothetical protein